MTPSRTPFLGLERLGAGDPLSSDGYAFVVENPVVIDIIAKVGAITHRHDGHAAMANPSDAPVLAIGDGGVIPGSTPLYVTYTIVDADGGESAPVDAVSITTPAGFTDPQTPPVAVVDHVAGTLLAATLSYAVTVRDGLGGETAMGPSVDATVYPGYANAEVTLSGLAAILAAASGGALGAEWALWRSNADGVGWFLIGTGTTDTFVDTGVVGDGSVNPPSSSTTRGTNNLKVTVPGGQPAGATAFNIYASLDGSFTSPALLGNYPIADTGVIKTFNDMSVVADGAPPSRSRAYRGANRINPDTDILDWSWKRAVATAADLPAVSNEDGDTRVTLDDKSIHIWDAGSATWETYSPGGGSVLTIKPVASNAYTLVLADGGKCVEQTCTGAGTCTIPPHADVPNPVGTVLELRQAAGFQITVTAGAGVTLDAPGGGTLVKTEDQWSSVRLHQRALDEWVLSGRLSA